MSIGLIQQSTDETLQEDSYLGELNRLFNLYRICNLNARYYGCRAEKFENLSRWALIVPAFLSFAAVAFILSSDQPSFWTRALPAVLAGISAVVGGITPFWGWTEKVRELRNLNFAYSQLFGQFEFVITEIRRAGNLTPEHVGLARMAHEAFMRVEALDELEPNQKVIDREDAKVRAAFPPDYLWTNF